MTDAPLHSAAATANAHLAGFEDLRGALPGAERDWVARFREGALARFQSAGLPTRRLEDWKFTGLDGLARAAFAPAPDDAGATIDVPVARLDALTPEGAAGRLVFVGGTYRADLSRFPAEAGVTVLPLAEALGDDAIAHQLSAGDSPARALVALNAAFMSAGAFISLADGAALDGPIVLITFGDGTGSASHIRNVVALGQNATARIAEIHGTLGEGRGFSNTVTDIDLAKGASLHHARIAAEGAVALHHAYAAVHVGEAARYAGFALSVGGALTRQETELHFEGAGAGARLLGAYLGRGHQHMDHTTRVFHDHPGCTTEELFKGVLDDHAHGVFQGLIHVAPHAVKTDARQQNRTLLLSDRAVVDTKPELEILADDVKCAHGAAVGDLDADELFYLRARGLPEGEARKLLIGGFIEELVARVEEPSLAALIGAHAAHWLEDN